MLDNRFKSKRKKEKKKRRKEEKKKKILFYFTFNLRLNLVSITRIFLF